MVKAFGGVVRAFREERGYSIKELAKHAGLSEKYVGDVEHGTSAASLRTLYGLAGAFNMTLSALFSQVEGAAQRGEPPPTLDLPTWLRLQRELPLLVDFVNRVVAQAGVERPRYRRVKR